MEPIPNWFRWLIIIIATLIMCACRAPLQQPASQSVLKRNPTPSMGGEPQSVLTTLTKLRDTYDLDANYLSSVNPPEPSDLGINTDDGTCHAPIIQLSGKSVRVQNVNQLGAKQSAGTTKAPVYFHVDDRVFAAQHNQAMPSTDQSLSPFLDDPELPTEPAPLAPIVDPSFELAPLQNAPVQRAPIQNQQASEAYPTQNYPVENYPTQSYPSESYPAQSYPTQAYPVPQYPAPYPADRIILQPTSEPMIGEYQSVPLAPSITAAPPILAAPFDFLPQAEIPIDCAPEYWATAPADAMGISFAALHERYPDEYVCDGGDALGEVSVLPDWTVNHLDPEDTVGHYDTLDHKVEVAASNRVCIYAPRFAAVRKVTSPFENEKREQVLIEKQDNLAVTQQQEVASVSYQQSVAAKRHLHLQPASSLQRDLPGVTGIHVLPVREIDHDLSVHEDFRVMKLGIHKQAEKPRLAEFAAKAITWSADKAVQVVVDDAIAHSNLSYRSAESIHTIGDNRPAKLRVIKTASVSDALPGEEVEFTLRFDNIGHQPMGNVTIIDNLTTRLEYLNKTELCSLKNEFMVDDNEVESLTLRWEITDPIMPGKGGLIRFKCRVR